MKYNFEHKTFKEIFEYGLKLAKERSEYCNDFFDAYINYILEKNPDLTYNDAVERARDNFGYYAGYYGNNVRKLIAETYHALHPYFGDRYDISSHEAFMIGYNRAQGTYINQHYNRLIKKEWEFK